MHRRTPIMLLLAALVLMVAGLAAGCGTDTSVKTYQDADYGFSFDYPGSWKLVQDSGPDVTSGASAAAAITVGDPEGAKVDDQGVDLLMVQVYELPAPIEEAQMPDLVTELDNLMAGLQSQDTSWTTDGPLTATTVGGAPAYKISADFTWSDGTAMKTKFYFVFAGSIEYQLVVQASAETWTKDQAVFDAFIASFKPTQAAE